MTPLRVILSAVSETWGVSPEIVMGRSRAPEHLDPRFALCLLGRRAGYSYPQIGMLLGRDHTTVIHGERRAKFLLKDARFAGKVDAAVRLAIAKQGEAA